MSSQNENFYENKQNKLDQSRAAQGADEGFESYPKQRIDKTVPLGKKGGVAPKQSPTEEGKLFNANFASQNKGQRQEVVSITYEEIGLFPRSFSRVLDRFLKQIFSDVENLVIQEYRFYRYLFLTTLKCVLILVFVPLFVNFVAKTYVVKPLTEYFWNTKQTEIFLNSYQQKRAFSELKEFEEKTYFESLIFPKSVFKPNLDFAPIPLSNNQTPSTQTPAPTSETGKLVDAATRSNLEQTSLITQPFDGQGWPGKPLPVGMAIAKDLAEKRPSTISNTDLTKLETGKNPNEKAYVANNYEDPLLDSKITVATQPLKGPEVAPSNTNSKMLGEIAGIPEKYQAPPLNVVVNQIKMDSQTQGKEKVDEYKQTESLINTYALKSSLFVYQTQEADKNIQQRYQEKTIELAQRYNNQSIEAITNFFADLISLVTLFYLLYILEIQINITKSFLLEVFFGLDDSKKSLFILLITDLLVGYHSSNLWELFFEFLFHHYGLPESQTGIFLLVATLPVLLDVLFKYLIFRHLNRSSPATVATYRAMIE